MRFVLWASLFITAAVVSAAYRPGFPWAGFFPCVACPVVAVRVPDRRYESEDEFLRVLAAATPEIQEFTLRTQ